jgi:HSP20 family protein
MEKFVWNLFSNNPIFDMNMDGCKCGDTCDCSQDDDKCGCGGLHNIGKTLVYGIDVKIGPDGKPVVKEWGNIPSPYGMPQFGGSERIPEKPKNVNIEVIEHIGDNKGKIIAEMPGVNKDSFSITVRNNMVFIDASLSKSDYNRVYNEKVKLPMFVNVESIKATYTNGVLEITFEYDKIIDSKKINVE